MSDKPAFIKEHSDDGQRLISIDHIVQIKMSDDKFNALVLTINNDEWIRVSTFYEDLKNMVNLV